MAEEVKEESKFDPKTEAYLKELMAEEQRLGDSFPNASRLIQEEIDKCIESGRARPESRYLDIYHDKPTKISARVIVPFKDFPSFNFVGKLLGPKGSTMKSLQEETKCRFSVFGRGSMKDKAKEESLRQGLDPKYAHLNEDLHVALSTVAPPAEAHARVAYALAELRKHLEPDDMTGGGMQFMGRDEGHGNGFAAPARGGSGRGARGGARGVRGASFSPRGRGRGTGRPTQPSYDDEESMYQDHTLAPRGRGAMRGGRGAGFNQRQPSHYEASFQEDDFYPDQYSGGHGDMYEDSNIEGASRRMLAPAYLQASRDDAGRGRWKQRGGASRFGERSAPYSRRN